MAAYLGGRPGRTLSRDQAPPPVFIGVRLVSPDLNNGGFPSSPNQAAATTWRTFAAPAAKPRAVLRSASACKDWAHLKWHFVAGRRRGGRTGDKAIGHAAPPSQRVGSSFQASHRYIAGCRWAPQSHGPLTTPSWRQRDCRPPPSAATPTHVPPPFPPSLQGLPQSSVSLEQTSYPPAPCVLVTCRGSRCKTPPQPTQVGKLAAPLLPCGSTAACCCQVPAGRLWHAPACRLQEA